VPVVDHLLRDLVDDVSAGGSTGRHMCYALPMRPSRRHAAYAISKVVLPAIHTYRTTGRPH
jgi:hypothetical protein